MADARAFPFHKGRFKTEDAEAAEAFQKFPFHKGRFKTERAMVVATWRWSFHSIKEGSRP